MLHTNQIIVIWIEFIHMWEVEREVEREEESEKTEINWKKNTINTSFESTERKNISCVWCDEKFHCTSNSRKTPRMNAHSFGFHKTDCISNFELKSAGLNFSVVEKNGFFKLSNWVIVTFVRTQERNVERWSSRFCWQGSQTLQRELRIRNDKRKSEEKNFKKTWLMTISLDLLRVYGNKICDRKTWWKRIKNGGTCGQRGNKLMG